LCIGFADPTVPTRFTISNQHYLQTRFTISNQYYLTVLLLVIAWRKLERGSMKCSPHQYYFTVLLLVIAWRKLERG
jgi:NADH:ubiquinone oxidoreductase subunit 3 (subunit A)